MELLDMFLQNLRVDIFSSFDWRICTIKDTEERHESWIDSITTSALWWDASNKLCVNNFSQLKIIFGLMVELVSSYEEETECKRLLSTINIDVGHIHIIDKDNHLLASRLWTVLFESFLVNILHEVLLKVGCRSSWWKIYVQNLIFLAVKLGKTSLNCYCFGCSRIAAEASWFLEIHDLFEEPRISDSINCWNKNWLKFLVSWCYVFGDHRVPFVHWGWGFLDVKELVIKTFIWKNKSTEASDKLGECFSIIFEKTASKWPHNAENEEPFKRIKFLRWILVWLWKLGINQSGQLFNQI